MIKNNTKENHQRIKKSVYCDTEVVKIIVRVATIGKCKNSKKERIASGIDVHFVKIS